jgi:hypothetical protein
MAASNVSEGLNAVFSSAPLLSNTTPICLYTNALYAKRPLAIAERLERRPQALPLRPIFHPRNAEKSVRPLCAALTFPPVLRQPANPGARLAAGIRRRREIAQ